MVTEGVWCSSATDVPNIDPDGACYVSSPNRLENTYDCDRVPDSAGELTNKQRVCCCNGTAPPPPPTCETPVLGAGNQSCTEACVSIGKQCTVGSLASLNPLVDTETELGALMASLGRSCTYYVSEFGYVLVLCDGD